MAILAPAGAGSVAAAANTLATDREAESPRISGCGRPGRPPAYQATLVPACARTSWTRRRASMRGSPLLPRRRRWRRARLVNGAVFVSGSRAARLTSGRGEFRGRDRALSGDPRAYRPGCDCPRRSRVPHFSDFQILRCPALQENAVPGRHRGRFPPHLLSRPAREA